MICGEGEIVYPVAISTRMKSVGNVGWGGRGKAVPATTYRSLHKIVAMAVSALQGALDCSD